MAASRCACSPAVKSSCPSTSSVLRPKDEAIIRDIIIKPHGIFLVTGPTGSGENLTSLYAFLSAINSVHKRIITIEEPVEYELKGINQIAVRSDIGLTFAMGLYILRQDPNVVLVGEIRDQETAEIAIRASLTGHLVLSDSPYQRRPQRIHAFDGHGHRTVFDRLLRGSRAGATIEIRTICQHYQTEQKVDHEYLRKIGFPADEISTAKFWHGVGCEECRQLGYQGRERHLRTPCRDGKHPAAHHESCKRDRHCPGRD